MGLRSLRRPSPCLSRTRINLCGVCQICTLSGLHGHRPCRRHRSGLICGGGGGDGSGDVSAGLVGGDHNAKVPFALSAAPWRTNGREHARGRARARARARESTRKSTRVWCVCVSPTRASFLCVPLHPHHTAPHTTPHHTTPHHTTPPCPAFLPAPGAADGVNGTWRCGQCVCVCVGVGVGVHVLCCGDHAGVCRDKHARSVCRARARKSTRACGADAFNDAFSHTLQPGCLALVVTVQSPTNGRPRRFGKL